MPEAGGQDGDGGSTEEGARRCTAKEKAKTGEEEVSAGPHWTALIRSMGPCVGLKTAVGLLFRMRGVCAL